MSRDLNWDLLTRLIHWLLTLIVVMNLFILEENEEPHAWLGYLAVALVCARTLWGFVGSEKSRFRNFIFTSGFFNYFRYIFSKIAELYTGYNPISSWVYLGIWVLILSLGVTGWMLSLDLYWGDESIKALHEYSAIFLQVLIVIHLLGILIDSIKFKRHTWLAMIRGKRE